MARLSEKSNSCKVIKLTALHNIKMHKNTEKPGKTGLFRQIVAEKARFELARRLTRPTPLAGAPLRPTWVLLRIGLPE